MIYRILLPNHFPMTPESVQAPQRFLLRDPEPGNHDGNDLLAEIPSFLVNREREFLITEAPFRSRLARLIWTEVCSPHIFDSAPGT